MKQSNMASTDELFPELLMQLRSGEYLPMLFGFGHEEEHDAAARDGRMCSVCEKNKRQP